MCVCPRPRRSGVDVQRGVVFLAEDALAQPVLQEPGGARVSVLRFGVAGLLAVQLQPDDVVGAGLVEPVLQGRVDHVVGRGHHVGQCPHLGHVVADAMERTHVGHVGSSIQSCGGTSVPGRTSARKHSGSGNDTSDSDCHLTRLRRGHLGPAGVRSPSPSSRGTSSARRSGYRSRCPWSGA